jgi:hypothetical protein
MNLPALACLAMLAAASSARAVGHLANVEVSDRTTGAVLQTYYHHGEYWIAGPPGHRYSISVQSRLGERLLAVAAVDGVNVISGETAAWTQSGYVLSPWQSYDVTGWRKSDSEVAAFEFTAEPDSYASRTGRPGAVGVIGVALFRERQRLADVPLLAPPVLEEPAASAPSPASRLAEASAGNAARAAAPLAQQLGTGHGERESSYVQQTSFLRRRAEPDELIRIRYDSRERLVALGVIRERPPLPTAPNPFPGSGAGSYVPDPPSDASRAMR